MSLPSYPNGVSIEPWSYQTHGPIQASQNKLDTARSYDAGPTGSTQSGIQPGERFHLIDFKGPGGGNRIDMGPAPSSPGWYVLKYDGRTVGLWVQDSGRTISTPDNPDADYTEPEPDTSIDPANYAGIVNADNETGVALAPSLRREGASLGPEGATVQLPDGRTVEVSQIQDADEVARVIDGPNQGDVIESDQSATSGGSSGSSGDGQTTSDGQGFGMAAAAVGVLALGYYATQS